MGMNPWKSLGCLVWGIILTFEWKLSNMEALPFIIKFKWALRKESMTSAISWASNVCKDISQKAEWVTAVKKAKNIIKKIQ